MAIDYGDPLFTGSIDVPIEVFVAADVDSTSEDWKNHLKSPIPDLQRLDHAIDDTWSITTTISGHTKGDRKLYGLGSKVTLMTTINSDDKTVHELIYKGPTNSGS
jgi:hypothetical protein